MDPVRESEMEMGLRNEGSKEPHIDSRLELGSNEEPKLMMSFNVPDKGGSSNTTRASASWLSVLAAKKFQRGSNRRQGAETSYQPLDSHEQDENQESHEQGETQESGGQAGIPVSGEQGETQESGGQAGIPVSGEQGETQESGGQAGIPVSGEQVENQENRGQAGIPVSGEQVENQENRGQCDIQVSPGQDESQGSREEFGKTSRSYIRMRHKALMNQFNSYAVLLVLVAGAMSVAILQPPGSFDSDGNVRKVAWYYLMLASESFLVAMIGLVTVMLGFNSLSNPVFYDPPRTSDTFHDSATSKEIKIIDDNISRLFRVGSYLSASLINCLLAFCFGLRAVISGTMFLVIVLVFFSGSFILIHLEMTMPSWSKYCSTKIKEMIRGLRRPT